MEVKNKLITEDTLRTYNQSSEQTEPGTNTLTPGATAKIQLNKKYAYLLNAASEKYNQEIEQKIQTGSINILCPELQDINDYMIITSWQQLNHDRVYNMYISDLIVGMRVYNILNIQILKDILSWYLYTNNIHLLNQQPYKHQLITLLHKHQHHTQTINHNTIRNILNTKEYNKQ